MKFPKDGSEEKSEMILQKSEQRMLALLEQFSDLLKAFYIVTIQIKNHFVSAKAKGFEHFFIAITLA
jgi:hypothetical protein